MSSQRNGGARSSADQPTEDLTETMAQLGRQLERERALRHEAEQLLERKSGELYQAQRKLKTFDDRLETLVDERSTALREALLQAEVGTRAKSDFLAAISHEIRTPLNGVVGLIELLNSTRLDPQQRNYIDTLLQSTDTLTAIISDALDLAKIEAGRFELESHVFSPMQLARNVESLGRSQADQKGLTFTMACGQLPEQLVGDPTRLHRVWLNLLSNAIKYTERGEVIFELHAQPLIPGLHRVYGAVNDTGIGIPEPLQARLFDAFTVGDLRMTRRQGGTGMGLAISSRLLRMMGGDLQVRSRPGEGSRFEFSALLEEAPEKTAEPPRIESPKIALDQLRVLVAEDNPVNQLVAMNLLQTFGIDAELAIDGREAVRAVIERPFDVVLMDLQMPELDGLQATRAIRETKLRHRQPRVIAVTANAFDHDRRTCLAAGMNDFIAKPFRLETLRDALLKTETTDTD